MSNARRYVPMHLYDQPARPAAPPVTPTTLWTDDMEGILNWTGSGTGADWGVALDNTVAHSPTHDLVIHTRTTTPTPGDYVLATRSVAWPGQHVFHFDTYMYTANPVLLTYLHVGLQANAGAEKWQGRLRYDHVAAKWQYETSAGGWTEIAAWAGLIAAATWYHLQLDIDMNAHKYVSAVFGASTVDLSAQGLLDVGAEASSYVMATLRAQHGASFDQGINHDDVTVIARTSP